MQKTTKKAPSLQVNDAATVKPTTAAKTPHVTTDDRFHYFTQGYGITGAAMNVETSIELSNAVYNFYDGECRDEVIATQNLIFEILNNAIANIEEEGEFSKFKYFTYVKFCQDISQLLHVCRQIKIDTNNFRQ